MQDQSTPQIPTDSEKAELRRLKKNASQRAYCERNREACRSRTKAWHEKHPEYARETQRRLYNERPEVRERRLAESKAHQKKNIERTRERKSDWKKRNLLSGREYAMRRYGRKKGTEVTKVNYGRILETHGSVCHICKAPIEGKVHFDHVVPLSRGGAHVEENILPAHPSCNQSKGSRLLSEMDGLVVV